MNLKMIEKILKFVGAVQYPMRRHPVAIAELLDKHMKDKAEDFARENQVHQAFEATHAGFCSLFLQTGKTRKTWGVWVYWKVCYQIADIPLLWSCGNWFGQSRGEEIIFDPGFMLENPDRRVKLWVEVKWNRGSPKNLSPEVMAAVTILPPNAPAMWVGRYDGRDETLARLFYDFRQARYDHPATDGVTSTEVIAIQMVFLDRVFDLAPGLATLKIYEGP